MKRIFYQVVVAKTSVDNELMNYDYAFRSAKEEDAIKFATELREKHRDYAFIVLEERHERKDYDLWELDHEAGGEKVLDHF